jgi:hypothetical protein
MDVSVDRKLRSFCGNDTVVVAGMLTTCPIATTLPPLLAVGCIVLEPVSSSTRRCCGEDTPGKGRRSCMKTLGKV